MDWMSMVTLDRLGAMATIVFVAWLVITDRLVWHTRLTEERVRAQRWESVALDALRTGTQAGVRAAEVSNEVLSRLPDAAAEKPTQPQAPASRFRIRKKR